MLANIAKASNNCDCVLTMSDVGVFRFYASITVPCNDYCTLTASVHCLHWQYFMYLLTRASLHMDLGVAAALCPH